MSTQNGFTKNADLYRSSQAHAQLEDLEKAYERLPSLAGQVGLDVATGTGHTAFFFARKDVHMFAVDINREMLAVAQEESDSKTLGVRFLKCPAEELNFDDDNFTLVTCRLAAHHFADQESFLSEVARVLQPGGHFLLIDNVVPDDEGTAKWLNDYEKKRDSTHQLCRSAPGWEALFGSQGLKVASSDSFRKKIDYQAWMERMSKSPEEQEQMWEELLSAPEEAKKYWNPRTDEKGKRWLSLCRQIIVAELGG